MSKVYLFLADGFEEVEALTAVDILRRGGVEVKTVSIMDSLTINGSHGIKVEADLMFDKKGYADADMLVLPGGGKGTQNLKEHKGLNGILIKAEAEGKYLAAICAAPSVLGLAGILDGKKAVCYPGFELQLIGATIGNENVVKDGKIITSRGAGTAMDFALKLLETLEGEEVMKKIKADILY